ncbi:MAG: HAMP domain-containing protein [Opitutaceae bacterium]|nr:HAMP domain-containing protein [Opitutaceae bacterium]
MKSWWQWPIRSRLTLFYAIVGALLLACFSATLYYYVHQVVALPLTHQLARDKEAIERRLTIRPDGTTLWDGREVGTGAPWAEAYPWFELWDEHGKLHRRFWPFPESRVQRRPFAPEPGSETLSIFRIAPDLRLRVLSAPFAPPGQEKKWMLRAMRIHEPAADALAALRWIIFFALPVVVVLLAIAGYTITRHWLRPLETMIAEADRISADELKRRLPVGNQHDELGSLARVFNRMLDRLEGSFATLDRFVADASHELRTPLTTLRSVGEVALRRTRTAEEYRETIGSMLEEAQRLELLTGRLLELATAESGAADVHRVDLAIDSYVATCVHDFGILAEAREQHLAVDTVPCRATVDPVILRQALQNLIDNAIKYSPAGATIRVGVREAGADIEISVTDQGPGIASVNEGNLAKRFFRPDRGRDRSRGGFGLGLSITQAYMRVLGGALEYHRVAAGGSTFLLRLPKSAA